MTTLSSLYGKGLVSDVAYPTGWDGETDIAPSKNVVYDEMETKANIDDPTFTTKITTPTINLTGGQIAFPATAVLSADANTLDDYEEGSFTPTISFGGASVGITYASQLGFYTKIGNRVIFDISIELTSKGTSTGNALISGLPFSILDRYTSVSLQFNRITFANVFQGRVVYNTSTIELTEVTEAGVRTFLTDADFADNSGSWQVSATYPIS